MRAGGGRRLRSARRSRPGDPTPLPPVGCRARPSPTACERGKGGCALSPFLPPPGGRSPPPRRGRAVGAAGAPLPLRALGGVREGEPSPRCSGRPGGGGAARRRGSSPAAAPGGLPPGFGAGWRGRGPAVPARGPLPKGVPGRGARTASSLAALLLLLIQVRWSPVTCWQRSRIYLRVVPKRLFRINVFIRVVAGLLPLCFYDVPSLR